MDRVLAEINWTSLPVELQKVLVLLIQLQHSGLKITEGPFRVINRPLFQTVIASLLDVFNESIIRFKFFDYVSDDDENLHFYNVPERLLLVLYSFKEKNVFVRFLLMIGDSTDLHELENSECSFLMLHDLTFNMLHIFLNAIIILHRFYFVEPETL